MSASAVQTKMSEAAAAIEAGDHAEAITKATAALALLAAIPNATMNGGQGMQWDRMAIREFITQAKSMHASAAVATGLRRTKIKYVNADSEDEY